MQAERLAADWLRKQYGDQAIAVAGCYHRALGDGSKDGATILEDMRRALFIYETTARMGRDGHMDPLSLAIAEGRRQAYLHLVGILGVTAQDLKPTEGPKVDDTRSAERPADGGDPLPRYAGSYNPALDGTEPDASPAGDAGSGAE